MASVLFTPSIPYLKELLKAMESKCFVDTFYASAHLGATAGSSNLPNQTQRETKQEVLTEHQSCTCIGTPASPGTVTALSTICKCPCLLLPLTSCERDKGTGLIIINKAPQAAELNVEAVHRNNHMNCFRHISQGWHLFGFKEH